jgi:retinol dehydrogenase-12
MDKKIALVTGGTSGLGLVTAKELARQGFHVVITARNPAKALPEFELLECDFASLQSIRDAAAGFKRRHSRLDVLVNNAGALNPSRKLSRDGLELTFAVNHLGYFLFTNLLLDLLKASAPSRIVSVASEAARWGSIDFADLQAEKKRYVAMRQYGSTKRMNIAFALELAERLRGTGVTSNALHPGVVGSNFGSGGWMGRVYALARPLMLTPEQGARTQIWLASSPEVEGVTGGYFVKKQQRTPPDQARDPEVRRKLWEVSETLAGLSSPRRAAG